DAPLELAAQLTRSPVAHVEEGPRLAEATFARLVPQALRAVEVRHLDQRLAAGLQHAADLVERRQRVLLREVLEHAVREDDVEARIGERQAPRVADDVLRVDPELLGDAPRRLHALERRVDPGWRVAAPRGRSAPAAPVRSDLEEGPPVPR